MYIRKSSRTHKGKTYLNYLLVESVLTPKGPRQKIICSQGDLSPRPQADWLALAHKLTAALSGQADLLAAPSPDAELQQLVAKVRSAHPTSAPPTAASGCLAVRVDHPEAQALDVHPHDLETQDELAHSRDDDPEQQPPGATRTDCLHAVATQLDDFLARATKQRWSPRQILEHRAQAEVAERAHRSLEGRLRLSEIKKFKPMADYDWSWPTKIERKVIERALTLPRPAT